MDLNNILKNAGLNVQHLTESVTEPSKSDNDINTVSDQEELDECVVLEMHDGSIINYYPASNSYYDVEYGIKITENDPRIRLYNLEKSYQYFEEDAAG